MEVVDVYLDREKIHSASGSGWIELENLTFGEHELKVVAKDGASNSAEESVLFFVVGVRIENEYGADELLTGRDSIKLNFTVYGFTER